MGNFTSLARAYVLALSLGLCMMASGANAATEPKPCGPIPPIASGFGAHGTFPVSQYKVPCSFSAGDSAFLFMPEGSFPGLLPMVIFCHGLGAKDPRAYGPLVEHIVSRGYCVVYAPYRVNPADPLQGLAYGAMADGVEHVVAAYRSLLDTTRVGMVGHSFGAGAMPFLGKHFFVDKGWGSNGAFMCPLAPWYSFGITDAQLAAFPKRVWMAMEVFGDDAVNDHRMAVDIFKTIGIPDSQKVFLALNSDSCGEYVQEANHSVPSVDSGSTDMVNGLDYYGVYRVVDALAACAFSRDGQARAFLFGPNTAALSNMGRWPNGRAVRAMTVTHHPSSTRPPNSFLSSWNLPLNPRSSKSMTGPVQDMKSQFEALGRAFGDMFKMQGMRAFVGDDSESVGDSL